MGHGSNEYPRFIVGQEQSQRLHVGPTGYTLGGVHTTQAHTNADTYNTHTHTHTHRESLFLQDCHYS